jgi:two-component system, NtrC family, response regulator HydG
VKQIVLADDDQAALDGLRSLLVAWGYEVNTAQDGRTALALVNEVHPSVVITDVVMPAMNGLELLEAVRRDEPAIPVIVLTAHGTPEIRRRAVEHGAFAYVPKPVDTARLRLLLDRAVQGAGGTGGVITNITGPAPPDPSPDG